MTMTIHEDFLELAAAEIDFGLTSDERRSLDLHLATCQACRRLAVALRADQVAMAGMPALALHPARVEPLWRRIDRRRANTASSVLRMVAIAALLALAAQVAFVVGSQLLQHRTDPAPIVDPNGLVVRDSLRPSTPLPAQPGRFAVGAMLNVVVNDLRVRTAPTVDNTKSAKLEPLLRSDTRLQVLDGPVFADDYEWYLVQAIDQPHRGWVVVADHDGEPWVEGESTKPSAGAFSPDESDLVRGLRADAAVNCAPRRQNLPAKATAGVECRVATGPVQRVGAYRFDRPAEAEMAYLNRLASYGVAPSSGDCTSGRSGDATWSPTGRSGCFLDENGTANVRVTCDSTYVGVLGRDDALADLYAWTWQPADPRAGGATPGVCVG